MSEQTFLLQPFEASQRPPGLTVSGSIQRAGDSVSVRYLLEGPLEELILPAAAPDSARLDALWQTTCLELFLGAAGSEPYWEFNLSPAGHWNVYRLEGYRRNLSPEPAFRTLPLRIQRKAERLQLDLDCALPSELAAAPAIEAAVTAVVEQRNGTLTYWALAHPGPEADFHRRDGFLLNL